MITEINVDCKVENKDNLVFFHSVLADGVHNSHDFKLMLSSCSRRIVLEFGDIVAEISVKELLDSMIEVMENRT